MGGQAFANTGVATPRMPPEIYEQVLAAFQSLLLQHYTTVASPIEAPGKTTYGDIDILVCGPRDPPLDPTVVPSTQIAERLSFLLNSKKFIRCAGNPTMNFAIPWFTAKKPEGPGFAGVGEQKGEENVANGEKENKGEEERYIQLDVHHCSTPTELQWTLFHHAHGDLWNILGTIIRRFGLTVNNLGLFLRIPSIEFLNRKRSHIFLSSKPSKILDFLGLEEARFWKRFDSVEEMFEYATTCRMFWVKERVGEEEQEGDFVGEVQGQEGGENGKKKLKHNDRERMNKRVVFSRWMEEFLPACHAEGRLGNVGVTREQIRDDAFARFPGTKEAYERRELEWELEKHKDMIWNSAIKEGVPLEGVDGQFRAASIRLLKKILMEGEKDEGREVEAAKKDEKGFWHVEAVRGYVMENWRRLGKRGMKDLEVKAAEGMRKKEELKREKERLRLEEEKAKEHVNGESGEEKALHAG